MTSVLYVSLAASTRQAPTTPAVKMVPPSKAREICTLEHGGSVNQVAIANNNQTIFTGDEHGVTVKVWDLNHPGAPQAHIDNKGEKGIKTRNLQVMKLTPDSSSLVVGGSSNDVFIMDVGGAAPVIKSTLKSSSPICVSLAFSPDGRICYTGHNDGTVAAWDFNNQEIINKMEGHDGYAHGLVVTTDGTRLWSGGEDQTVRLWDVGEAKQLKKKDTEGMVKCLGVCPSEEWVVASGDSGVLEIFSGSKEDKHTLNLHSWGITSVKFANSEGWFAVTTKKGMLCGFPTPIGPSMFKVEGKQATTKSCDISRDDTLIVTGNNDYDDHYDATLGTARVYALE